MTNIDDFKPTASLHVHCLECDVDIGWQSQGQIRVDPTELREFLDKHSEHMDRVRISLVAFAAKPLEDQPKEAP